LGTVFLETLFRLPIPDTKRSFEAVRSQTEFGNENRGRLLEVFVMISVLVAEDSPTARALIVEILRGDPEIQVVGEARDGAEAVALAQALRPQVITMDIRMPRLDGFQATKEIMITAPTPIVIVTASDQARDVEVAMHSLRAGAVAVLHKPPGLGSSHFEQAAGDLIATVKAMSQVKVVRHWRPRPETLEAPAQKPVRPPPGVRGQVVAIATSTGGPAALARVLADLPGDFPAPILVVQHITAGFTEGLADWLDSVCDLRVKVAEPGEALATSTVYLAPDNHHLGVAGRAAIAVAGAPPVGGFRPSGTYLFESVARSFGGAAVAVILTGMGEDGVQGLRAVRRAGGRVIAQDEKTSVVFGMPGAAVAAGLADQVLPLDAIAARLVEWVQ
jgi:two-component system chemotaxis response regulator CheB